VLWLGVLCGAWLVVSGCAARAGSATPEETLVVPYSLRTLGVGSQEVSGRLILDQGTEQAIVSNSLIEALQSFHLSVVDPSLGSTGQLSPGRKWTTDKGPLLQAAIDEHNRAAPSMRLSSDRYYGIQYSGEYSITRNEFVFSIRAVLHERGALSDFRPYPGKAYSGRFFVDQLKEAIRAALDRAAKPRSGS
jgi:hypothetical protein